MAGSARDAKSGGAAQEAGPREAGPAAGDPDVIGRHLRDLYGSVEREALPERLTALLRALAETEDQEPRDGADEG